VIEIETRRDQTIALFGLGASGLAAARALSAGGANVLAWDDNSDQREKANLDGIQTQDLYALDFSEVDALVLAPGIPLTHNPHAVVEKAQANNRQIIGDIELLVEACPTTRFVGITGTNGKSTTTALVGHILESAGLNSQIGGNLGPPALGFERPADDEIMVLELSSFQLDLTQQATFDIAVFLNISPDHIDRHGDMDGYIKAKRHIFRNRKNATADQIAVIGVDDENGENLYGEISALAGWTAIPISLSKQCANGFYASGSVIYGPTGNEICDLSEAGSLPGQHNRQNAAAAAAVCHSLNISEDIIASSILSYPGLPHRIENVDTINGVTFVNDSKATNGEAAARALACYDEIFWIAGGRAKEDGLSAITPFLKNIKGAFLIGEAASEFEEELAGQIPVTQCGDLENAVGKAFKTAASTSRNGGIVLLSPACASFDQWRSFEARGDAFKQFVANLAEPAR
tara:strand:- start:1359 stop:2741 length:1383 start_codon:yes stop_codon:yes gene_type:complete